MFESADGLLTAWTRQNEGRSGIVTVSDSFSEPAGTSVDSTIVASAPNVRPFKLAHAAPVPDGAVGLSGLCADPPMATASHAAPARNEENLRVIDILPASVSYSARVLIRAEYASISSARIQESQCALMSRPLPPESPHQF